MSTSGFFNVAEIDQAAGKKTYLTGKAVLKKALTEGMRRLQVHA